MVMSLILAIPLTMHVNIYTDNGVGSTGGTTVTVNTTYKMIYYPTSGNPFGTNIHLT